MHNTLVIYKENGLTPLQAIEQFRKNNPAYQSVKLAYAGRLDPMAEGLLLLLVGDECKKRKYYERLDKTYQFTTLLGVSTDSYDALGQITACSLNRVPKNLEQQLSPIIIGLTTKINQLYPPYSAARVNGKPLYYWARQNLLNTITLPTKIIEVFSLQLNSINQIPAQILQQEIAGRISKVQGDFRQSEILTGWQKFFTQHQTPLITASLTVRCSSGTYVRSLAHQIGQYLGCGALALEIKRIKIGNFSLTDVYSKHGNQS